MSTQEFQRIRELNNKKIVEGNYSFKLSLSEIEDCFRLEVTIESGDCSKLLPHLERKKVICYDKTKLRFVKTIQEIEGIIEKVRGIIRNWGSDDDLEEINSELILYQDSFQHSAVADVGAMLDLSRVDRKIKISIEEENKKPTITPYKKGKTSYDANLIFLKIEDIVNLGYIPHNELVDFFIKKAEEHNEEYRKVIFVVEWRNSRSSFYLERRNNKTTLFDIEDDSYATKGNSRTVKEDVFDGKDLLIVGVGAIGSHAIQLLASLWPRSITLVDNDIVDRASSVRQNFNNDMTQFPKVLMAKKQLEKFSDVIVHHIPSSFEKFLENEIFAELKYDYIFDFTGEGLLLGNFELLKQLFPKATFISSYIQNKTEHVKIAKFQNIDKISEDKFYTYDLEQSTTPKQDNKIVIKGCDPVLEYSLISVYKAATLAVEETIEYAREDKNETHIKNNG